MSLNKKQKLILNLLLLQEVDEEQTIINKVMFNNSNQAHQMFLTRKTEGVFSILIEKHLWRDDSKFREFFRLSRDQYTDLAFAHWPPSFSVHLDDKDDRSIKPIV
ncbi:hypothetical protein QTP88_026749 [Uroleucon formosanum]